MQVTPSNSSTRQFGDFYGKEEVRSGYFESRFGEGSPFQTDLLVDIVSVVF